MTNICRFTIPASRDIESIIDYVASNKNFNAADKLLKTSMGRKRDELYPLLRSFPVDDYLIFYPANYYAFFFHESRYVAGGNKACQQQAQEKWRRSCSRRT